jgi:proteasome lid subunit RPN8/RPN11
VIRIDGDQYERMRGAAAEGYPHEVVGILAGSRASWSVTEVVPLVNERADSPRNRYRVSGLAMMRAEQAIEANGLEVVGYYHSHPDHPAQYSEYDRDHALPNMSYIIVSVHRGTPGTTLSWRLVEDRSSMDPEEIELVPRAGEKPCP